ncbi:AAA family ATPase [Mycolicibacterium novocastrense]|nr:AAA family ATPase [Mycolicibacterium novocastrense]
MSSAVVCRAVEEAAVAAFLASARETPSALVIEGEAGIGKTTLWLTAASEAREQGFRVLSARAGQVESVLAFAALADLLRDIDLDTLAALPGLQRLALDRVLLRAGSDGPATDQRVVGAGFLSVLDRLVAESPLLIAVDDAQWLDTSSQTALAYAVRRVTGPVGVLLTERCGPETVTRASWIQLSRPDTIERIRLLPLTLGGLHRIIAQRLGRSFPRPTMIRIAEISGGNPFYALEIARAIDDLSPTILPLLPTSLTDLTRVRLGRLSEEVRRMLLTAASATTPTVDLLARATDATTERVVELLEDAEAAGIVNIDGNRVLLSHPLLASEIYSAASPAQRRSVHRVLASVESEPELQARHLALATTTYDENTLKALDAAAEAARARGAPAAAAELVDLAIRLGGDTPVRRIRSASHHFQAGETVQAEIVLAPGTEVLEPGVLRALALILTAGIRFYENRRAETGVLLRQACDDASDNPPVLIQALLMRAFTEHGNYRFDDALHCARRAVTLADQLGVPALQSQALAAWVHVSFQNGRGFDSKSLQRALELHGDAMDIPILYRPSAVNALLLAQTGQLEAARSQLLTARHRCIEWGAESDMMAIAGYTALIDVWGGRFADAAEAAHETVERAEQLGGGNIMLIPLSVRAVVSAYLGLEDDARDDVHAALEVAQRAGAARMTEWPIGTLVFVEVSRGAYHEATSTFQRLGLRPAGMPSVELMEAWHIPDAVEAMVAVGELDGAEPWIEALESNGLRLERAWMLAVGARCRSMWLAARGDVDAAVRVVHQAMTEHDRLQMPFERARTQLLVGQLQRRQRQKESAATTLTEALRAFEEMGTPLWAARARAELARTKVSPAQHLGTLTPSQRRVAELVASGMTNRDVAAALFISPKTVEHNLSGIYRKLGIRSRAELGRRMDQLAGREIPDSSEDGKR